MLKMVTRTCDIGEGGSMDAILTDDNIVDLAEVYKEFQKGLRPWWDELCCFVPSPGADIGFEILPVMVLNAYNWLGIDKLRAIKMASLFRTINFANVIHLKVQDVDEGQKHDQMLQFTILIGDYIFGRVLKLLLETQAESMLDQFAAMIGTINEGFVLKYHLEADMESYLIRTRGPLYYNAFSSAARMQGWDSDLVAVYGNLGRNLGLALEMRYAYNEPDRGFWYLQQAQTLYVPLNRDGLLVESEWDDLVQAISR